MLLNEAFQLTHIQIALERRFGGGVVTGRLQKVNRRDAVGHGRGAGGVKGHVRQNILGLGMVGIIHAGQKLLGRASLMGGDDVREAKNILNGRFIMIEAAIAHIGLVADHQGGPLAVAHGGGAGVGEAVNINIIGFHFEEVVANVLKDLTAVFRCGLLEHFNGFDAEGLGILAGTHDSNLLYKFCIRHYRINPRTAKRMMQRTPSIIRYGKIPADTSTGLTPFAAEFSIVTSESGENWSPHCAPL